MTLSLHKPISNENFSTCQQTKPRFIANLILMGKGLDNNGDDNDAIELRSCLINQYHFDEKMLKQ